MHREIPILSWTRIHDLRAFRAEAVAIELHRQQLSVRMHSFCHRHTAQRYVYIFRNTSENAEGNSTKLASVCSIPIRKIFFRINIHTRTAKFGSGLRVAGRISKLGK